MSSISEIALLSVNVASALPLGDGVPTPTGIDKRPVTGSITVGEEGLVGDAICNRKHHGGPHQAIYCYSAVDYTWFAAELQRELVPGWFGENLTLSGPRSSDVAVGDRFTVDSVVLEVTSPRIPCNTLNRRMGDSRFGKLFRLAERPGWYCRVLAAGSFGAGAQVRYEAYDGDRLTMAQMMRDYYAPRVAAAVVERYRALPVHPKTLALIESRGV